MVRRNVTRQKNRLDVFIPCLAFPREKKDEAIFRLGKFPERIFLENVLFISSLYGSVAFNLQRLLTMAAHTHEDK